MVGGTGATVARTSGVLSGRRADRTALARRRMFALALLLAQGLMQLALAFDIQWHRSVGRDDFRIPPHLALSAGVGAIGGLCLAIVLRATWSHWRGHNRANDAMVTVLGLFRAPVGAILGGCGALITGLASLLDNLWWHALYGPDFILWAPFHTMGLLGAILTATGILFLWGDRWRDERHPAAIWGLRLALAALLGYLLVLTEPATWQFPTLDVGPLQLALAPLFLLALVPWPLIIACRWSVGWGAASVVGLLLARDLLIEGIVPTSVYLGATLVGAPIRPTLAPHFRVEIIAADLLLLLAAWPLDRLRKRGVVRSDLLIASAIVPLWFSGVLLTALTSRLNRDVTLPGFNPPTNPPPLDAALLALPAGAVAALAVARFGAMMSDLLRGARE